MQRLCAEVFAVEVQNIEQEKNKRRGVAAVRRNSMLTRSNGEVAPIAPVGATGMEPP